MNKMSDSRRSVGVLCWMPEEDRVQLKIASAERRTTMSGLLREALEAYLKNTRTR